MSPLLKWERTLDLFAGLFYLFRWLALPVIRTGTLTVLISVSETRGQWPYIPAATRAIKIRLDFGKHLRPPQPPNSSDLKSVTQITYLFICILLI